VLDIAQGNRVDLDPQELGGAGIGIDADLGAIYELPALPAPLGFRNYFSLTFNNLLATSFSMARAGGSPPQLPRLMSLGFSSIWEGWGAVDNIRFVFDLASLQLGGIDNDHVGKHGGNFFKHVNWGAEATMAHYFAARLGFHQGYLTAGLGADLKYFTLDVATYTEELSSSTGRVPSRRYEAAIRLGLGSAPPAPMIRVSSVPYEEPSPIREDAPKNDSAPPVPEQAPKDEGI